MKKSQLTGFTFMAFTLFAAAIIAFGAYSINRLAEKNREAELQNLVITLQNTLTVSRTMSRDLTFSVPSGVESICFVDPEKNVDKFANKRLSSLRNGDYNLFFSPESNPQKLQHLSLAENPLCVRIKDQKVTLHFEGLGNSTQISSADAERDCVSVVYNTEKNIDIVFLGYKYGSTDEFSADVNEYINNIFFKIEPFVSKKVNFFRVDDADLDCVIGDWISCDSYQTNLAAANCPHDFIIVLANRNALVDTMLPVRSSAIGNIVKLNSADNKFVLMHEMGHAIGGLADEYVDSYYEKIDFKADEYPNCDNPSCGKWAGIDGAGCFSGCSRNTFFRPTKTSIMKELGIHEYGVVNSKMISGVLDAYE